MLAHAFARQQTKAAPHRANVSARTSATPVPQRLGRADEARAQPSWDFGELPLFAPDRALSAPIVATLPLQAKLVVGPVDDPLEREADRVADRVMRMPEPAPLLQASPLQLSRKCEACEEEEEEKQKLQKKVAGGMQSQTVPPIVHEVLRSPGQPLDAKTRAFMEPRFGWDFGAVRVHADEKAARAASATRAVAYTVGEHLVFRPGAYDPSSSGGRWLLAHELTHVLQQQGGLHPVARTDGAMPPVKASLAAEATRTPDSRQARLEIGASNDGYEQEADRIADRIMTMQPQPPLSMRQKVPDAVGRGLREGTGRPALQRLSYSPVLDETADGGEGTQEEKGSTSGTEEMVQQKSADVLQRVPLGDDDGFDPGREPVRSRGGTLPHREATELVECVRILGEESAEFCRQQVLGEKPQPIIPCTPLTALTWADFQGPPPRSSFAAETDFDHDLRTVRGVPVIWATFDSARSWVQLGTANPGNRTATGCARNISACTAFFGKPTTAATFSSTPPRGCAAATAHFSVSTATNSGECTTVLGAACDAFAQDESDRVLNHEQFHFHLACALAQKGTAALGSSATANRRILTAVRRRANVLTVRYDNETAHGCNPGPQATWENNIRDGLPKETIP